MTPDDLDTKSLEELDEIFAVEICEWERGVDEDGKACVWPPYWPRDKRSLGVVAPPFSSSADAILPWLEKCGAPGKEWVPSPIITFNAVATHKSNLGWNVDLGEHNKHNRAPTFPHAAVKALIRAERAKKGNL